MSNGIICIYLYTTVRLFSDSADRQCDYILTAELMS